MSKIEYRSGDQVYSIKTPNNFVAIFLNGTACGFIRLEFSANRLNFFKDMVLCRLPALPEKIDYPIAKRRIELKSTIVEMFGDHDLMKILKADPPVFLYDSPRTGSYRGNQWVIISYSSVPIGHFTLVS